ncbi:YIP1 family protein [Desulfoplanes formicivorans]|nr:YIP1 family protein [Desulfoplanes formicivorans]
MAQTPESTSSEDSRTLGESGTKPSEDKAVTTSLVPWEHLDQFGFFPGLMETIKQVMLHPIRFFGNSTFGPGIGKALVFYLLIAEIQALAQFFWQMTGVVPMMGDSAGGAALGLGMMGMGSAFILIMYPLILTVMLFAMVGINHLCLVVFKAADQGFVGTFKAVTYGSAPMVLAIFPLMGPLAGALWTMVTTFFGYKHIHQTTTTKVVLAMLLPVLFTGFLVMLFFLLGTMSPEVVQPS